MDINPEVYTWAEWVAKRTDIPPEIIYSQWHLEAGPEGIADPAGKKFNLAGLTKRGVEGIWRTYNSLQEFAYDFTYSFLYPNYPKAMGQNTIPAYVEGLKNGRIGSYFGTESQESYGKKLQARYSSLFPAKPKTEEVNNLPGKYLSPYEPGRIEKIKSWLADKFPNTYFGDLMQGYGRTLNKDTGLWERTQTNPETGEKLSTRTGKPVETVDMIKQVKYVLIGLVVGITGVVLLAGGMKNFIIEKGGEKLANS